MLAHFHRDFTPAKAPHLLSARLRTVARELRHDVQETYLEWLKVFLVFFIQLQLMLWSRKSINPMLNTAR